MGVSGICVSQTSVIPRLGMCVRLYLVDAVCWMCATDTACKERLWGED